MKTKEQLITHAQTRYGSSAKTFRGAFRAIRQAGAKVAVMPLPRDTERYPSSTHLSAADQWYDVRTRHASRYEAQFSRQLRELPADTQREGCTIYSTRRALIDGRMQQRIWTPREAWLAVQSRARLDARMMRLAGEYIAAGRYLADRRRKPVALLDRQQYTQLAMDWSTVLTLPTRDDLPDFACKTYGAMAMECAESYHSHIHALYTSKHSDGIRYGGAETEKRWDVYSKRYGFPCIYSNAGVTVSVDDALVPTVHLHPTRGNQIDLPLHADGVYSHSSLLDGDLYAKVRTVLGVQIVTRYDARDKATGVAVPLPDPRDDSKRYWEHGKSVAECRTEWERKRKLYEGARLKAAITRKQERKARLVARLCGKLPVSITDARAVGYCTSGIDGFRQRYGIGETATVAQLRGTGDARVNPIIALAARKIATTEASNAHR